jgi:hypothetical protein
MLRWDQYGFDIKRVGTRYDELVLLHPVGSACHVVHFGTFVARNMETLFFMVGWDQYRFEKSASGHVTPNLCFCIQWDLRVT